MVTAQTSDSLAVHIYQYYNVSISGFVVNVILRSVFVFICRCRRSAGYTTKTGVTFAGVTQEREEDLRYFVETYQRPLRSVSLLADQEGALTEGYQGAHGTNTIPHCYVVKGGTGDAFGVVEWHGHPTRLEQALIYILDTAAEEAEEAEASGVGGGKGAVAQAEVPVAVPVE